MPASNSSTDSRAPLSSPSIRTTRFANFRVVSGRFAPLEAARAIARADGLSYAGDLTPRDTWQLAERGDALLVDVRSAEELKFVGCVPGALHVPWARGIDLERNPDFVDELAGIARTDDVVLLLCRSGIRSVSAAIAATNAGFTGAFNVLEGFEGDRDVRERRGSSGGWRYHGLPWIQG